MKVGILSDFVKTGGAAIAADRITQSLRKTEVDLFRISSDGCKDSSVEEEVLASSRKHQLLDLCFAMTNLGRWLPSVRSRELCRQLDKLLSRRKPDLINVHNLHSSDWPTELVEVALRHCPVSWTLHDCSSFLASYYPSHSPKPSLRSTSRLKRFWQDLEARPRGNSISAIAPSKWMRSEANASYWGNYDTALIPNPISPGFKDSGNSKASKEALGLKPDKPVVLAIAGNLDEERKGGQTLHQILRDEKFRGVQFILIGLSKKNEREPPNVHSLGLVGDELLLRIAYSAADFTLHPAPVDNLPNTVIESLACGTPVLAFPIGGLPDMVVPGTTGWLAEDLSSASINREMENVLSDRSYLKLGDSTKRTAIKLFDEEKIASQYHKQFQKIIEKGK